MCGRFVVATPTEELVRLFSVDTVSPVETADQPNYNVTPGTEVLAIRERIQRAQSSLHPSTDKPERVLSRLRWGLVPRGFPSDRTGGRLINARLETVAEKPAFRRAFTRRRCLIPVTGFYEWQVIGNSTPPQGRPPKRPMYVHRSDNQPLAFAGLWEISDLTVSPDSSDRFQSSGGEKLRTCSIITTAARGPLAKIHHRMPVILPPAAWSKWLNPKSNNPTELFDLVKSYPSASQVADEFDFFPVSPRVNRPAENSSELIIPVVD